MSEAMQVIREEARKRVSYVIGARDDFAKYARNLVDALRDSRIAARSLSAVDPEHDIVQSAVKYDGEVRELVAEMAALFVDDGGEWIVPRIHADGRRDDARG